MLSPRRTEFKASFGNKLSPAANAVLISSILCWCAGPTALNALGAGRVLRYWWTAPLLMFAAAMFYGWTCRAGAAAFAARRERILAAIERQG